MDFFATLIATIGVVFFVWFYLVAPLLPPREDAQLVALRDAWHKDAQASYAQREFTVPRVNALYALKQQRAVIDGRHPLDGWFSKVCWSKDLGQHVTIAANRKVGAVVVLVPNEDKYDVMTYLVPDDAYDAAMDVLNEHANPSFESILGKRNGDCDGVWGPLYQLALPTKQPRSVNMNAHEAFYHMATLAVAVAAV